MTRATLHRQFEDILPRVRQPARLTGGEPGAGPGFGASAGELRVALGFPDTYEIGISNQALQILYSLARGAVGVAVERTYLPWVDAIAEMRSRGLPLLTLETWSPVAEADVFGLTLQHESSYTNLLEMLDLAGIPLRAAARQASDPLVMAGGPACADFLPVARFLDAVVIGDGEEVFPEILGVLSTAKTEGAARQEMKLRLSRLEGVFVPGVSTTVARRVVTRLADASYPAECLVPLTAGVHDRAWVEVMRGCTRGCRFCQAGMWYRPVRERPAGQVIGMAGAQLDATGHQELAYASLSTTDYTALEQVLGETALAFPEVRISLPSLRVDSAAVRLAGLASPTGPSLTLAPEAGSQRMRDVINKNVTHEDVLAAAEEAFRGGRTTLKLYFMIGLPGETDDDVQAIADLCLEVRDLGRRALGSRSQRMQLNISVNNFIPKPFTPFQWAGMAERQTLRRRQELLRSRLRRPGVRLDLSSVDKSYLEAALARGGEDMGAVIEQAWRLGARFDSWTEQYRGEAWQAAFASAGTDIQTLATSPLARDTALPWEVITGTVSRDFLWAEWERAERAATTPDCRWDICAGCGVCQGSLANDLAAPGPVAASPGLAAVSGATAAAAGTGGPPAPAAAGEATATVSAAGGPSAPALAPAPAATTAAPTAGSPAIAATAAVRTAGSSTTDAVRRWRYAATFTVTGRARFIGHLDRVELLRRVVRRAGGRLAMSAGMRPKPVLSLALPLAVGVESRCEWAEFELAGAPGPDLAERLAASLPAGMCLLGLEPYEHRRPLAARVEAVSYEVIVVASGTAGEPPEAPIVLAEAEEVRRPLAETVRVQRVLSEAATRFAESATLPVEEAREGAVRTVDVRRYVDSISIVAGAAPPDRPAADAGRRSGGGSAPRDDLSAGGAGPRAARGSGSVWCGERPGSGAAPDWGERPGFGGGPAVGALEEPPFRQAVALAFRIAVTPSGSARPERVVDALVGLAGVELHIVSITRTAIHLS